MLLILLLIGLLFLAPTFLKENFTDVSGEFVKVSLKDLLTLMKEKNKNQTNSTVKTQQVHNEVKKEGGDSDEASSTFDEQFYKSIKGDLLQEVRTTVRDELKKKEEGSVLQDSCIDSIANQQGTDWIKYIPGKNPDDYIRKDSIPCYGCSLA